MTKFTFSGPRIVAGAGFQVLDGPLVAMVETECEMEARGGKNLDGGDDLKNVAAVRNMWVTLRVMTLSPSEEAKVVQAAEAADGALTAGQTYYLIPFRWFRSWVEYTGYDGSDPNPTASRPGPIETHTLLFHTPGESKPMLKPNLLLGNDYQNISAGAWEKLGELYRTGPAIPRKVIASSGGGGRYCTVEVYPMSLSVTASSDAPGSKPVLITASRVMTIKELQEMLKKEFNLEGEEFRIWSTFNGVHDKMFEDLEQNLQDAWVDDGDAFVVEVKKDDVWPFDKDRVDAFRASHGISSVTHHVPSLGGAGTDDEDDDRRARARTGFSNYGSGYFRDEDDSENTSMPMRDGITGLSNLGNTCFMNSGLQCLSNTEPLTRYFLAGKYKDEINKDNPIGCGGALAEAYGDLLQRVWKGRSSAIAPRDFKWTISQHAPQFSGYQQHDSQELLSYLIDGLHEDLNRILKKPATEPVEGKGRSDLVVAKEAWDTFKLRNDSVVVDLFEGQYKSTLICPKCNKVSITFDPFLFTSVPLPRKLNRVLGVTVVWKDPKRKPTMYGVEVPLKGTMSILLRSLSSMCGLRPINMLLVEVFHHRVQRGYGPKDSLDEIATNDLMYVYEVDDARPIPSHQSSYYSSHYRSTSTATSASTDSLLNRLYGDDPPSTPPPPSSSPAAAGNSPTVPKPPSTTAAKPPVPKPPAPVRPLDPALLNLPILHRTLSANQYAHYRNYVLHAVPSIITVKNGEITPKALVAAIYKTGLGRFIKEGTWDGSVEKAPFAVHVTNNYGSSYGDEKTEIDINSEEPIEGLGESKVVSLDWTDAGWDDVLDLEGADDFERHASASEEEEDIRTTVELDQCIDLFTNTERLGEDDMWYCPTCKEFVQASKKFDFWKLPEILVVHLKRFSYDRWYREKLDTLVKFPLDELDMTKHMLGPIEPGKPPVYELYGVSNHYGAYGGGHYTAYAKNFMDKRWHSYDDAYVSDADERDVVTSAAYVLFYRRKADIPAGDSAPV